MKITYQYRGATLWVQLEGELDHHTAQNCRRQLDEVLAARPQIRQLRLNLSGLDFMDSSGIGVLIGRYKIMKERRGIMTLYGLKPAISKIVDMAGLAQIMNVE
jgi:stage II sporulation protein AA (anti-sigma F factor antagonist)